MNKESLSKSTERAAGLVMMMMVESLPDLKVGLHKTHNESFVSETQQSRATT